MRCEDIREQIAAFVLGELDPDENEAVRSHLDSCEKCSAETAQYRQVLLALGRWKVPAHGRPPGFAFLPSPPLPREDVEPRRRRYKFLAPSIAAASIAALLAVALLFGVNARVGDGTFSLSVGRPVAGPVVADSARIAAIVDSVRRQDMQIMSALISASEARQSEMYRTALASFSRRMDDRQKGYALYLMNHIYRLQQQDQVAYYQSRAALDGVVRIANSVK